MESASPPRTARRRPLLGARRRGLIAVGLYKVFIDETLTLPKAISCNNFDDLKHLLVKVTMVILVILFLEKAVEWQGEWEILGLGVAMALMIAAATWSIQKH